MKKNSDVGIKKVTKENYRLAIEQSPVPMIMIAEDGVILLMNDAWLKTSGYSFEEIDTIGKWTTLVHGNRKEFNNEFIKDMFDKGITSQGGIESVITKSGEKRLWSFSSSDLGKLDDGRRVIISVGVDVTDNIKAKKASRKLMGELTKSQILLEASLESHKDMVILSIDVNYNYYYFNELHRNVMKEIYNSNVEIGSNLLDCITIDQDRETAKVYYDRALKGESVTSVELYGDSHDMYFESSYSPILSKDKEIIGVSVIASDITKRMEELAIVKESEEKFRLIYSSMSQGLAVHELITDDSGKPIDSRYLEVNESYMKLMGFTDNIIGKRLKEIAPNIEDYWIETHGQVAITGEPSYFENYSKSVGKHLSSYAYSPKPGQFAVLLSDITDRIKREKEIEFLSYNDQLTEVYNRRYYEEQFLFLDNKKNLPLSLIMGDVNGLKLVNDSFGHLVGDELLKKVAKILKRACRSVDVITRIGGDEFVIILPKTSNLSAKLVIDRIKSMASQEQVENIDISISFGYGTKENMDQSMTDIFKQIEDDMYRQKLNEGASMRSKTVNLIMTTLYEKNEREMHHSQRVGAYCAELAEEFGLPIEQINQVRNAGLMHDIGKIGISELILNKTTALDDEEWLEVQKHSEIGYRILSSLNEFRDIAMQILEHHERWDGTGYPKGMKDEDICLQARIISIADAYDAMTGPRTYRDSLSEEEAINELIVNSGKQFDPTLVDIFIKKVIKKNKKK